MGVYREMVIQFVIKEIVESVISPRFLITFSISTALILISVFSGYQLYKSEIEWQESAESSNQKRLSNLGSYGLLEIEGSKAFRTPSKLSILVRGTDSAIGKGANINEDPNIVLRDSRFALNPVFAAFGEIDLAFIVSTILSLFALLFSYNAISGERELGTLKQVLSNSISRAAFIIGKSIGGLVVLAITFLLPLLIALTLLISFFNINFSAEEWAGIGLVAMFFLLYLAVFYMIGMLTSALTRNSFVSFLLCLFIWVLSVAIVPRLAVEVAGWISPAPSIDKVEAERAGLRRTYNAEVKARLTGYLEDIYKKRPSDNFREERQRRDKLSREARKKAEKEALSAIADREKEILDNYHRGQLRLINIGSSIARVSPTACINFAAGRLCGTDIGLQERFRSDLERYRKGFLDYTRAKIEENPAKAGVGIGTSTSTSMRNGEYSYRVGVYTPDHLLEIEEMPTFIDSKETLQEALPASLPDLAILAIEFLAFFAAAVVAFLRYDVR